MGPRKDDSQCAIGSPFWVVSETVKVVLLGATKGIGRALARKMSERGDRVFLLGRDPIELARSARDLEIRGTGGPVAFTHCDLEQPETFATALRRGQEEL